MERGGVRRGKVRRGGKGEGAKLVAGGWERGERRMVLVLVIDMGWGGGVWVGCVGGGGDAG